MSKVQVDNLEAYAASGTLTVLSPLTVAATKTLQTLGPADLDAGLTVDGSGDSVSVGTGNVFIDAGDLKVGGTTGSPAASIANSGAAVFSALTVNGVDFASGIASKFICGGKSGADGTSSNLFNCAVTRDSATFGTGSKVTITFSSNSTVSSPLVVANVTSGIFEDSSNAYAGIQQFSIVSVSSTQTGAVIEFLSNPTPSGTTVKSTPVGGDLFFSVFDI